MKTPSLLLPLLAALSVSAAAADAPRRCDDAWLAAASGVVRQGGTPNDPKKYLQSESIDGGTRLAVGLSTTTAFPCDQTIKLYLLGPSQAGWTDAGLQTAWKSGLDQQLKILLAAGDLYGFVDPRGRVALDKADAVVDAAVKLGVSSRQDGRNTFDTFKAAGVAGDAFLKDAPYSVGDPAANAPAVSSADMKAALTLLLKDQPVDPKAKGPAPQPVLGPGVLAFRKAVIDLADELAVRSTHRELLTKRGVDAAAKFDFAPGAGVAKFAALVAVQGAGASPQIPDSVAANESNYRNALKFLTDPAITSGDDASPHPSAALSQIDFALRDLIALRAAAVDAAVLAARKRLNGSTVKAALATLDGGANPVAPDPKNNPNAALSAEVLTHLQGIQDYKDLNALYDKNKNNADWVKGPEGVAVAAQLDTMRKDAASASVAGGKLSYTVGGQKLTDEGIRVAAINGDADYRGFIADAIAQNIASNPLDAKVSAALAAFRGQGTPGTDITTVPPKDKVVAPPIVVEPKKDPPPPPKPKTTWQQISNAAPSCFFCGGKEDAERFVSKQREADAEAASQRQAQRDALQRAADQVKKRAFDACQAEATRINNEAYSPDYKPETVAAMKKQKVDALNCSGRADGAFADFVKKNPIATNEQLTAATKTKFDELDRQMDDAYTDGVTVAAGALKADYKNARSGRRRAVENATGYKGQFYDGSRVDAYFTAFWAGDKLNASVTNCKTALGFKMGSLDGAGFKDPSVDNVDGSCGVRDDNKSKPKSVLQDLILHMNSYKGTK